MDVQIAERVLQPQHVEAASSLILHEVITDFLARRLPPELPLQAFVTASLKDLIDPSELKDMDRAAARVADAIMNGEVIGLETDHDCDGQTSHAVMHTALITVFGHPKSKCRSYIGHRLQEGYGLSWLLLERILKDEIRPTLVITADNGSSDEPRIEKLKEAGMDVVVTDHHEVPLAAPPASAYAVVNPNQPNCTFKDKSIAGCMVAFYLMVRVRQILIDREYLAKDTPKLGHLLDLVAVGTMADCVSLAKSLMNRAVVRHGLKLITTSEKPIWRTLKQALSKSILESQDLAFTVAPLLNSDGRLMDAMSSVEFLLTDSMSEAARWYQHLYGLNQERKAIQERLLKDALVVAEQEVAEKRQALVVYLPDGHVGVHGIVASKLKDRFGLPTVMLAPKGDYYGGSVRGVDGLHMQKALATVQAAHPECMVAFGGHQGAAGLTLHPDKLECFKEAFHEAILGQLPPGKRLMPVLMHDGALPLVLTEAPLLETFYETLSPFGKDFEVPNYEVRAVLLSTSAFGQDKRHTRLWVEYQGRKLSLTYFYSVHKPSYDFEASISRTITCYVTPRVQEYRGEKKMDFLLNEFLA